MSEENSGAGSAGGNGGNGQEASAPPILINIQYTKDLSFEAPLSPAVFEQLQKQQPDVTVNIEVKAQGLSENVFEVVLFINSECKVNDQVAFIMELSYGGVFTINAPEEHHQALLLIECPRLMFPFARNIVADVTRDGGFPPLMLGPVDFVSMYQNQVKELVAGDGGGKGDGGDEEGGEA